MLEWFTTIPGLLIACGVIILVIAIILFALGAKKSKKEVTSVNNENVNNNVNPVVQPLGANVASVNEQPVQNISLVQEPIVEPVVSSVSTMPVENTVVTTEVPEIKTEENVPVINIPVVEEVTPVQPEVINNVVSEPVIENTTNSIYGGEVPTYNFEQPVEKPVTIYGGNDPMEATQTLPKVEEYHEPYGGYPEVKIIEPTVESVIPTPVEDVVSIPNPQPVVEEKPVVAPFEPVVEQAPVINIPDMEDEVEEL